MRKFLEWPSIEQFRHVVKEVRMRAQYAGTDEEGNKIIDRDAKLPKVKFTGTVKIHGTNAGIGYDPQSGEIWAQSRSQILGSGNTNFGFWDYVEENKDALKQIFEDQITHINYSVVIKHIYFFGEWCGPNIQKGVAVSYIPNKSFVLFGIRVVQEDGDVYSLPIQFVEMLFLDADDTEFANAINFYNIFQFGKYEIEIDFENPEAVQNELVRLTEEVEANCPVGKFFGIKENTVGEGIVWSSNRSESQYKNLVFKVKGEKHSVSKVKTLAAVDVEKVKSIDEFVENTVTENRLRQGLEVLRRDGIVADMKATGDFVKWVSGDILKEESDMLEASGLTMKDVGSLLSTRARKWFHTFGIEAS